MSRPNTEKPIANSWSMPDTYILEDTVELRIIQLRDYLG